MSNDEYMKLYEQFKPMIIKLVHKWSKLNIIEFDELMQISLLALIEAYNSYDETRGKKFSTYVYDMIEYKIRKEIYITDRKNKRYKTVSLNSTVESGEGETTELLSLLADDLDLEEEIQDKIMMETYKAEITANLDQKKADVMILKYFYNQNNNYIEKVLNITGISNYIRESRMTLIRKSKLFRSEYKRIHHIDDYSNPAAAIIWKNKRSYYSIISNSLFILLYN